MRLGRVQVRHLQARPTMATKTGVFFFFYAKTIRVETIPEICDTATLWLAHYDDPIEVRHAKTLRNRTALMLINFCFFQNTFKAE